MFKIDKNIQALLYQYDCVVIPEFGGFVANYKPSQIKKDTHFIYPPSKVLSFNRNLRTNDGLLAKDISEKKSITFEEANNEIKEIVEDYFTQLNNGKRIEFEKVGILYFDKNKNILFDPFNNCNFLLDSFGMEAFFAPKSNKANKPKEVLFSEEINIKLIDPKKDNNYYFDKVEFNDQPAVGFTKKESNWKKYAVAASIVSILVYSGIIGYKTDFRNPKYISKAELNPFKPSIKHKYFTRSNNLVFQSDENSNQFDSADVFLSGFLFDTISGLETTIEDKDSIKKIELVNSNTIEPSEGNYYVVGGCFSNFENAKNYYSTLEKKGFNAQILERHNGLYPVVYGSYQSKTEAENAQSKIIESDTNKAWILKR
jgi:CCDC81-like prokaryotic HU domain 1/CCDC81-like prokaryotic HU domain 2/SPOR domain